MMKIMNLTILKLCFTKLPRVSFLMKLHARGLRLYRKETFKNFLKTYFIKYLKIVPFEAANRKKQVNLSTSKMCIDEKKLHFISFDYSVWENLLTFQFNVGCIPPSVCLWHIF